MNLTRNFTLSELIKSDTAIRKGINNNPNAEQIEKLKELCENILQPIRDHFECVGVDNAELFDWIKLNLEPDQLILEFYTPGEPNSGWIHCSWIPEGRRASFLHAYRSEGKTKYKPILGSARDVV
jgi:hypothetical protein